MSGSEPNDALSKPRRFLILMSLALIAYYALQVEVEQAAEYSGFVLRLGRADRAIVGLWFIWMWSVWRYGQKFYELMSAVWQEILDDVDAEEYRVAVARGTREANRLAATVGFERAPRSARARGRVRTRQPKGDDWDSNYPDGERPPFFLNYWPQRDGGGRKYPFEVTFDWTSDGGGNVNEIFDMVLSEKQVTWLRRRAWVYACFGLPAFNDYIAPVVVAMLALASPFVF